MKKESINNLIVTINEMAVFFKRLISMKQF